MFYEKSLKKALLISTTFICGIFLLPAAALADSCPSIIYGTTLAGMICDFDISNSVTVVNGGVVGSINQNAYNPSSSFILNSGTISNDVELSGININNSSLSDGITNSGLISITLSNSAIEINNSSTVSGGVSNSGSLISGQNFGFQLDNFSTVNGDISNSGSIISNSPNNPALLIRGDSTVTGNINNSGTIRAYGDGDGIYMHDTGNINGDIINSGSIRGASGIDIRVTSNVNGNIINSGTITGNSNEGILITQGGEVHGNIINNAIISANNGGISADNFGTIRGNIINRAGATISGSKGIYINDTSTVNGSIQNYGTIIGSTNAISIDADSTVNGNIQNYGTITGDTYAIYISSSTVSNIDIFNGSIINGNINAPDTTVNIVNGGEINGTINVNSFNINSGATFTMEHTITAQNVTNAGALLIGSTTQTIDGDYTQSTGGVLHISAQDTTTYGQLAATGAVDFSQSGAIYVNILNGSNFTIGDTLSNAISGSTITGDLNVTDNSRLLNFAGILNNSNNAINLTAVDDASTSVLGSNFATGNKGGAAAAAKLDEIIAANPSGDFGNVVDALNELSNDQQITNATNQTTPALTGATNSAIVESMNTALRIVQARQQSNSGLSSGEDFKTNRNLWIKAFGSWGNQGNKDGVIGYNSKAYGLITGADKDISDKARLGVGVSYFNSQLGSNNSNNHVNVDSFLGIAYGSYNLDDSTEINTQVAAGYNSSHSSRNINFGGLNRVAKGSYDGWNFHAGSGISHLVNVSSDTTIAPQFRVDYFTVGNQGYNESGAGALNLQVASQMQSQLIPAVEVAANHKFTPGFSLALNAGLGYDLLQNRNTVSASFAGGGGEFITRGLEASPWIVRSGFGLTWKESDELDFTLRYDRRDRGNYDNQTVSLKLRVMF